MQLSTPEAPKRTEPKSILLVGPPGGGKTTLAMQFPKVAFLDCDRNLDASERFLRSKLKDLVYGYIPITYDDEGKAIPVEKCYDRLIAQTLALKDETGVETVVLDGITMINEFIVRKVLADQGNKEIMEPHFWTPFKSKMMALLVKTLRSLGKTTIVTCHEVVLEKPNVDKQNMMNPTVIGYRPAVQGGITDYFGGFFTDMWRCTAIPAPGGKVDYVIKFTRDALSDLKNSLGLPNELTLKEGELAWPKLAPYFSQQPK